MNDEHPETYSLVSRDGGYASDGEMDEVTTDLIIPDYRQSGIYTVALIRMSDVAGNSSGIYFSELPSYNVAGEDPVLVNEAPATIRIQTRFPDSTPPELDLNQITITAEPTRPDAPNGETRVDISFRIKDNISGYSSTGLRLRDPQGVMHAFSHYGPNHNLGENPNLYFIGDPTAYQSYHKTIVLPVGSVPGTWGLAEMNISDMAHNIHRVDFTEIVRFEVTDESQFDLNGDGEINILDLVLVAQAIGETNSAADVNGDGVVNILDLVQIANHL